MKNYLRGFLVDVQTGDDHQSEMDTISYKEVRSAPHFNSTLELESLEVGPYFEVVVDRSDIRREAIVLVGVGHFEAADRLTCSFCLQEVGGGGLYTPATPSVRLAYRPNADPVTMPVRNSGITAAK